MIATSQKTSLTSQKASSLGTWKPATTGVCRTKLQLSRARVVVKRRSLTEDWQRAVLCPAMDCYSSLVGREGAEVVVKQCPAVDSTSIVVGREGVEVVVEGLAADCSLEGGEETERCGGGGEAWEALGFPPAELQTPILTRWTPTTILPSMPTPTP